MQNWLKTKKGANISSLIITSVLFSFTVANTNTITWEDLSKVTFRRTYSPEHKDFYDKPFFSDSLKKLNKQKTQISGYLTKIEDTDSSKFHYILCKEPARYMPFYRLGKKEIIQINFITTPKKIKKNDEYLLVKGTLRLHDHYTSIPYVLENAELVKE